MIRGRIHGYEEILIKCDYEDDTKDAVRYFRNRGFTQRGKLEKVGGPNQKLPWRVWVHKETDTELLINREDIITKELKKEDWN